MTRSNQRGLGRPQSETNRFALPSRLSDSEHDVDSLAARYHLLLDNPLFPITYLDGEGRFLFVGRQGASNLGADPADIVGKTVHDFFPQEDADEYVQRFRKVIDADCTLSFEDAVKLPGGTRWFWSILQPLKDSQGTIMGVQITSHDVTDRKTAEADLEERLRFEQLISDLASEFVNVAMTEVNSAIIVALRSIGEFMGVDRSFLFQFSDDYTYLDCTHQWRGEELPSADDRVRRQSRCDYPGMFQKLLRGEAVVVSRTDLLPEVACSEREALLAYDVQSMLAVPIEAAETTIGVMCFDSLREGRKSSELLVNRIKLIGQMITTALARARAERRLQESRQLTQAITEASPHIVYVFDVLEARCIHVSPQAEEDLGYTASEIYQMGTHVATNLLHPDDLQQFPELTALWNDKSDDATVTVDVRLKHVDGSWRNYSTRNRVFQRGVDGSVRRVIGTMRDITEQKEAEEELQALREKLIHVARLSTMGEMVAGIAHELGQPLYTILNYGNAVRNVLHGYSEPRALEASQWIEQVVNSASRAGTIIHRFRDFARRSAPCRTTVDIENTAHEALGLVGSEIRRLGIQVEKRSPPHPLLVQADRVQLLQVVVNLLQNAIDAMCDSRAEDRIVTMVARETEGHVEFAIEDRGQGLPDAELKIFDAFVTTKEEGMGMGLAISKTLVESHGGHLWCETNKHGGAAFLFRLPALSGAETDAD